MEVVNIGFTHYVYRKKVLDKKKFKAVVADFQKVLPILTKIGVELAGWDGEGKPEITEKEIIFNGVGKCGHDKRQLGITWAAKGASGVALTVTKENAEDKPLPNMTLAHNPEDVPMEDSDIAGQWFVGAELKARTCGGDCSHETFSLPQTFKPSEWQKPEEDKGGTIGMYFAFCKTAYKPYDLAVNCCLIIAKHHLGSSIIVSSDGESEDWEDGRKICQKVMGYGKEFKLEEGD